MAPEHVGDIFSFNFLATTSLITLDSAPVSKITTVGWWFKNSFMVGARLIATVETSNFVLSGVSDKILLLPKGISSVTEWEVVPDSLLGLYKCLKLSLLGEIVTILFMAAGGVSISARPSHKDWS